LTVIFTNATLFPSGKCRWKAAEKMPTKKISYMKGGTGFYGKWFSLPVRLIKTHTVIRPKYRRPAQITGRKKYSGLG